MNGLSGPESADANCESVDCELWHALDDMTKLIDLKQIVIISKAGERKRGTERNRKSVKEA